MLAMVLFVDLTLKDVALFPAATGPFQGRHPLRWREFGRGASDLLQTIEMDADRILHEAWSVI